MGSAIGQVIADRWELVEVVGRGGHSLIYRAKDVTGGRDVAVKMLHEASAQNQELTVRMVREHRAMQILADTAAVRVLRLTSSPDGALCLVMELLEGQDLDDHLIELEKSSQRMSVQRLREVLGPVVDTLERAHEHDVVHRDLKPGNIYLLNDGGVRLIDFGLAKVKAARQLTREDVIIGSPSYIAPEVWRGNSRALDHRVDVYSLGAIVFRVLAGRVPFEARTIREKVELATTAERPSLHALRPDLPPDIDAWVRQALAIDPDRRFFRVRAMYSALSEVLEGTATRDPS